MGGGDSCQLLECEKLLLRGVKLVGDTYEARMGTDYLKDLKKRIPQRPADCHVVQRGK